VVIYPESAIALNVTLKSYQYDGPHEKCAFTVRKLASFIPKRPKSLANDGVTSLVTNTTSPHEESTDDVKRQLVPDDVKKASTASSSLSQLQASAASNANLADESAAPTIETPAATSTSSGNSPHSASSVTALLVKDETGKSRATSALASHAAAARNDSHSAIGADQVQSKFKVPKLLPVKASMQLKAMETITSSQYEVAFYRTVTLNVVRAELSVLFDKISLPQDFRFIHPVDGTAIDASDEESLSIGALYAAEQRVKMTESAVASAPGPETSDATQPAADAACCFVNSLHSDTAVESAENAIFVGLCEWVPLPRAQTTSQWRKHLTELATVENSQTIVGWAQSAIECISSANETLSSMGPSGVEAMDGAVELLTACVSKLSTVTNAIPFVGVGLAVLKSVLDKLEQLNTLDKSMQALIDCCEEIKEKGIEKAQAILSGTTDEVMAEEDKPELIETMNRIDLWPVF